MLDKIIILSNRKQAYLIFSDRAPFCISSDTDVIPLLAWFLGHSNAFLTMANDGETVTGIELRRFDDEITIKIPLKDVA